MLARHRRRELSVLVARRQELGFFADGKLKRIDVDGGRPLVVADAPNGRGGAWNSDGVILFSPGVSNPIMRVSTRGGPAEALTETDTGGTGSGSSLAAVPARRQTIPVLVDARRPGDERHLHRLARQDAVPCGSGRRWRRPLRRAGQAADDVAGSAAGVQLRSVDRSVRGEPVVVAQGFAGGIGAMAASDDGMLAYRTGSAQRRQLVWVDRKGTVLARDRRAGDGNNGSPELSADEQSVVVFSGRSGDNDIWVIELARGLARRITEGPPADAHPVWDPDGEHVVFNSGRFPGRGDAGAPVDQRRTAGAVVLERRRQR